MTTVRNVATGVVLIIVLFAAVAIIATGLLDEPNGAAGEDTASPIATEAIGPLSELEITDGDSGDVAIPIGEGVVEIVEVGATAVVTVIPQATPVP